jgi:hypothetical protein
VENEHGEVAWAAVIVVVLLGLASFFAWRQLHALRLARSGELSVEERSYHHRQAWRRLASCALMVVLAAMLAGWYFSSQAAELTRQARVSGAVPAPRPPPTAEQRRLLNESGFFWILFILVLLALMYLALLDWWAIRSFGRRSYRQIQADRQAMLEREVARLRSERNGH